MAGYGRGHWAGLKEGREEQNKGQFDVGFLKGYDKGHRVGCVEGLSKGYNVALGD